MPGVIAVRHLLATNAPLIAVVAASKIKAEEATLGADLPTIEVVDISTNRLEPVAESAAYLYTSRIQVNVLASTSAQRRAVLNLVVAALPRTRGAVNGVNVDSILYANHGPKFKIPETEIFFGSIDFFVRFTS